MKKLLTLAFLLLAGTASAQQVNRIGPNPTTVGTAAVGQIPGTTTNDDAASTKVGEYVSSTVSGGSAVSLSTGVAKDVTSISLTAGDWDVTGHIEFNPAGSTLQTQLIGYINNVSNTAPNRANGGNFLVQLPLTAGQIVGWDIGTVRYSLSGTTTIYLGAQATFTVSTNGAYGTIRARRVR